MKNRTKLWLVMLISAVGSSLLFVFLNIVTAEVWNKGYDLNTLNRISDETLNTFNRQNKVDIASIQQIIDQIHSQHPDIRMEWIASDGSTIYDTAGETHAYSFKELADRVLHMPNNLWSEGELITLVYSTEKDGSSYYLIMSLSSEAMKPGQFFFFMRTFKILFSLTLPLLLCLLVPYLLSIWFFSSISRRIGKLNDALNQVNIQSDVIELTDHSKDEIGQLTRHYNAMAQRIRNQARQIQQFEERRKVLLSNLSHDLKTPLTMILGYAETLRFRLFKDENEMEDAAKIILQRSLYMDKLLVQLLNISRQDADTLQPHFASHNLSELMRRTVAEYMLFLDGLNFTIDVNIPDGDVEAYIDASLVERALRNLLDNAIRHGKEGRYLGIGLADEDSEVCITVFDKGSGIAYEDHGRIFERLYRVNDGEKTEGAGVGLSIVKEIVELHQGHIELTSTPYERTEFLIRLPNKW